MPAAKLNARCQILGLQMQSAARSQIVYLAEGEGDVLAPLPRRKPEAGHQLAGVAGEGRHAEGHKERWDLGRLHAAACAWSMLEFLRQSDNTSGMRDTSHKTLHCLTHRAWGGSTCASATVSARAHSCIASSRTAHPGEIVGGVDPGVAAKGARGSAFKQAQDRALPMIIRFGKTIL